MKVHGLLLLCLSLLFIPEYSEAQTAILSNSTSPEQYRQLLEKEFFKTGNTFFDQGKYEDAITYYNKALNIDSTYVDALYNKGLALENLGKYDEAITYYDKVLAINPNDTDTLNNKGLALDKLGKHDEAITYYDKLLAINPTDADALYNKGISLDSLGKHDQAISYYKEVLANDPSDASALNKLSLAFNSADKNQINVFQQFDKTSVILFGIIISLLGAIIVISLVARNTQKGLKPKVSLMSVPTKEEEEKSTRTEIQDMKPEREEIKDDEWRGV